MDAVELGGRIRLAHASLQAVANACGADILHVKGYAATEGFYRSNRHSTDADILVRPSHVDTFTHRLVAGGWEQVADFSSGSAFQHAATIRHPWWGAVDIHRYFPGMDVHAEDNFDRLWAERQSLPIAHYPCTVPSDADQILLIMLHAGRDGWRGTQDIEYLRRVLSARDLERMRRRAAEFGAEIALAASLGELEEYRNHPDYLLWKYMTVGGSRIDEWIARYAAARTLRAKARVAASSLLVNKDHLSMRLGRRPSRADMVAEWVRRMRRAGADIGHRVRGGLGGSKGRGSQ